MLVHLNVGCANSGVFSARANLASTRLRFGAGGLTNVYVAIGSGLLTDNTAPSAAATLVVLKYLAST